MSGVQETRGTVDEAVRHAARLLDSDPGLAAEQSREILKAAPDHPSAALLLGVALRHGGDLGAAQDTLAELVLRHPKWALARYEYAQALGRAQQHEAAIAQLLSATALKPQMADAWRALGDERTIVGEGRGADEAYAQSIRASVQDPELLAAATALCENRLPDAETRLRALLRRHPTDVAAMRMLAEIAARLRRYADAETLLRRCLELAPGFAAARHNLAIVLHRQGRAAAAAEELGVLLAREPHNPGYLNLKAAVLARIGDYDEALAVYDQVLRAYPKQPKVWMSYGHALKTAARTADSIAAYRRSIAELPSLGEAYWSLANLKTFRFTPADREAMRGQLARTDLADDDRFHLHFALGKACEDEAQYAESCEHYRLGNELRRAGIRYDPDRVSRAVQQAKRVCTREFFAQRAQFGVAAPDPIFIVGLPRAGSTLIEQILSSHSEVEGTMELSTIGVLAKSLRAGEHAGEDDRADRPDYYQALTALTAEDSRRLGEQYLEDTRVHRKRGTPFFIDKMPNNFMHLALMQLILPNARFIDARRHPLGCCFSGFKQHFARGQHFSYRLEDLGRYYRDYVELMAHFDAVLPGRVHRVIYEELVADTEAQVRRLLAYCKLPFEERCLRFFENDRPVATASSEQVRQPIYREGLEQWRHFEPWLDPLKSALGNVLAVYPDVPHFESRHPIA